MAKIKSTGGLRTFLCDTLVAVADGSFDINRAREITKIASQINESLYSEMRVAKTQLELGREAATLGNLGLGKSKE